MVIEMSTHTARPMSRAIWLPPLRESLPNSTMTIASRPMSTTIGIIDTRGWGIVVLLLLWSSVIFGHG